MKKLYFITILFLLYNTGFAQYSHYNYHIKNDSLLCLQDISVYREFDKQGLVNETVMSWKKAYTSCKNSKKIVYQDGVKFLMRAIKSEKDLTQRKTLVDSMMNIYEKRIKYFGNAYYVKGRQGIDLLNSDKDRANEAYKLLQESLIKLKEESDLAVIANYMLATSLVFNNNEIDSSTVINNYLLCIDLLNKQIIQVQDKKESIAGHKKMLKFVDNIFKKTKTGTCKNLMLIFKDEIDGKMNNTLYLKKMQHLFKVAKCTDKNIYLQIALKLQKIAPTSQNAYTLSLIFAKKEDYSKSISYLNKAINLTNKNANKAKCYYKIAEIKCFKLHQYKEAKSFIIKSLQSLPQNGKSYMLLGDVYAMASSNYSDNKFTNSSIIWFAIDKYKKAKSVDKSLSSKIDQKIAYYKRYLPSAELSFMNGYKKGDKYKIGGWINEQISVY